MPCAIRRFASFERHLKNTLKKYPNSADAVEKEIASLAGAPERGFVYPGFGNLQVRKFRIALRAYRLSASTGLRLIFLYLPDKALVAPLIIYKKGTIAAEHQVKAMLLNALREILEELGD